MREPAGVVPAGSFVFYERDCKKAMQKINQGVNLLLSIHNEKDGEILYTLIKNRGIIQREQGLFRGI